MNIRFLAVAAMVAALASVPRAEAIIERLPSTSGPAYSSYPEGQQVATPFSLAGFAQVESIDWYGFGAGPAGGFRVTIFEDSSGIPGAAVFIKEVTGIAGIETGLVYDSLNGGRNNILQFSTPVSTGLAPGNYWFSVASYIATSGQFLWERSSAIASGSYVHRNGDTGTWVGTGTSEAFAFALHSLVPLQTNLTISLCCDTAPVSTNGAFTTYVIAQGPTNLALVNARIYDASGVPLTDIQVQPTNFNGLIRSGVIAYAHSNLVAGGSVSLTHIVRGPAGAVLGARTNAILLGVAEAPLTIGLCCTQTVVQANSSIIIALRASRPLSRPLRVAAEVRSLDGELLGSPWGSISNRTGWIYFAHPKLMDGATLTLINIVDNALGQLGGITAARLTKPSPPVVSFSRAERVIEPWGVVPIEVYLTENSQAGLPPEKPIRVIVRQTSGERRDYLGNPLPLESRELYFSPWQAFQEVSFGELATDATFVLETTGAELGKYSTFKARIGKPGFSAPDYISFGSARKLTIQVWRMDRQQTMQTVRFQTEDGTARAGIDYVPISGELVFGPEDQLKEFEVELLPSATPATSFRITYLNPELSFPNGRTTRAEIPRLISFGTTNYWLDAEDRLHFTLELNAAADLPVSASIAVPYSAFIGDGGGLIGDGGDGHLAGWIIGGGCGGHGEVCMRVLGTFTIPAGQTKADLTIQLSPDEWLQNLSIYNSELPVGERYFAQVFPAGWTDGSAVVNVYNSEVTEGQYATFTLARADSGTNSLTMVWSTTDGTATGGADYEPARGALTLMAGSSAQIQVQTFTDDLMEETESFGLVLEGTSTRIYARGRTNGVLTGTISVPLYLSIPSAVEEGRAVQAMINSANNDPVSFRYFTSDLSARAGVDYEPRSGMVSNQTTETIEIPLPDNPHPEPGKEFLFTVIAESPTPFTNTVRISIRDNEIPDFGEPLLVPELLYYYEGSPPNAEVVLQRTGDTSQALTVHARTRKGTAIAGEDYVPLETTIEFAPLEVSKVVSVSLVNDTAYEEQEEFALTFSIEASEGSNGFSREALFSISNDDPFRGLRMGRSPGGILFLEGIYQNASFKTAKIDGSDDLLTWSMVAQYRVPQFTSFQMAVPDENLYRFYRARLE